MAQNGVACVALQPSSALVCPCHLAMPSPPWLYYTQLMKYQIATAKPSPLTPKRTYSAEFNNDVEASSRLLPASSIAASASELSDESAQDDIDPMTARNKLVKRVFAIIEEMKPNWTGPSYDLLRRLGKCPALELCVAC